MKRFTQIMLFLLAVGFSYGQSKVPFATNQLILILKQDLPLQEVDLEKNTLGVPAIDRLNAEQGIQKIRHLTPSPPAFSEAGNYWSRTFLLTFSTELNIAELLLQYERTDLVETAEPNYTGRSAGGNLLPNDAFFNRQWGLYNDGSFNLSPSIPDADMDMDEAWEITTGSPDITMAILDNGCNYLHPEFNGRLWDNTLEANGNNGSDDDNNGYEDDILGWDFAYMDNDPDDAFGHGTNVAGLAAATGNNGIGYAGVDWQCRIMPLKILDDSDFGFYSWWAEAIYYATDNGADVINLSVAGDNFSASLQNAVDYAYQNGVLVISAMGNQDSDQVQYPAGFVNSLAVGATNANDRRSSPFFWNQNSGSNYGNHIDVVAPGNYMFGLHHLNNNYYESYWAGTSQAAPLVAGLATLMLSLDPNLSPDDIRQIIRDTAEDQIGHPAEDDLGFDIYYGYGRVNAYDALIVSSGVNTNERLNELLVQIMPNPVLRSEAELNLRLPSNMQGSVNIRVFNSLGKMVSQIVRPAQSSLDIPSPTVAGIYYVHVGHKEGSAIRKLIVQ